MSDTKQKVRGIFSRLKQAWIFKFGVYIAIISILSSFVTGVFARNDSEIAKIAARLVEASEQLQDAKIIDATEDAQNAKTEARIKELSDNKNKLVDELNRAINEPSAPSEDFQ